jgi:hypothetical protein
MTVIILGGITVNISKTNPFLAYKLLMLLPNQKTNASANSNAISIGQTETPVVSLAQKSMLLGYNKQGNEIIANTITNQTTVVKAFSQPQSSEKTMNNDTLNGKAAQYTGSLTADEIEKKYVNGDNITDIEYSFMEKGIGQNRSDADLISRNKTLDEKKLAQILNTSNIQLSSPGQELTITIDAQNKAVVNGIDDEKKRRQVEDALNNGSYPLSIDLAATYQLHSDTYKKTSAFYTAAAQHLASVQKYLQLESGGNLSITDISIHDDKIVGLPPKLDQLFNRNIPQGSATKDMKSQIVNLLAQIKVYGPEKLPRIEYPLRYKNGQLSCIEQPEIVSAHPETLSTSALQGMAHLLEDNPIAFYKWYTEAAPRGQV